MELPHHIQGKQAHDKYKPRNIIHHYLCFSRRLVSSQRPCEREPGVEAELKDSEVLTLMIAQDYIPYPGERQYIGYMRANHAALFPRLLDQSQYNRRARGLKGQLEAVRQSWVGQTRREHASDLATGYQAHPSGGDETE